MDIIAQLKAERDKASQQFNALDTAIRALSGLNSTRATGGRRTMSAAARATNFCRTESPLGTYTGPEGCLHRSQASHLSRRSSADQSSK